MAAGIATRGAFLKQFDKTIQEMYDDGMEGVPEQAGEYFVEEEPDSGTYNSYAEFSGLEKVRELGEHESVDYVLPVESDPVYRYFTKFGLGYQATMEAIQDELWGKISKCAEFLGQSAAWQYQISAFDLLNSGNTGTYKTYDNKAIFSATHATLQSGETLSNLGAVALSETGMQAAFEYFDLMKTSTGAPNPRNLNRILVHAKNRWTAQKLLIGTKVLGSANNDILTTNPSNGVMNWTYDVGRYLTDEETWFAFGDKPGLTVSWKMRPTLTATGDWDTEGKLFKVLMRFAVYANRFQELYGSFC